MDSRAQALFSTTPSTTLATSSHLSTAVSMTSKISFHLMICTGSVSHRRAARSACGRAITLILKAIDFDAVSERFIRFSIECTSAVTSPHASRSTFARSPVPFRTALTR